MPRAVTRYYDLHVAGWADNLARQLISTAEQDYHKACEKYGSTPQTVIVTEPACPGLDGAVLAKTGNQQWLAAWKGAQVVFVQHTGPDNSAVALAYLAALWA